MAFESVQVQSSRNGGGPVQGYREDLVGGDTLVVSLSDTRGVFSYLWEVVGRPEFGVAGGSGPNPWVLGYSPTASFVVDSDSGSVHRDGSYKVACTINKGSPNETVVTTILCRVSGLTVPGPVGDLPLRKLAPFEALEDTSVGNLLAGWATQINRWLDHIMGLGGAGAGPSQTWSPSRYYVPGYHQGYGRVASEIAVSALTGAGDTLWGVLQQFDRAGTITDLATFLGNATSGSGKAYMAIYEASADPKQPGALLHSFQCSGGGFNTNYHDGSVGLSVAAGTSLWFVVSATSAPSVDPLNGGAINVSGAVLHNYLGSDFDPGGSAPPNILTLTAIRKQAVTYAYPPPDPFPAIAAGSTDVWGDATIGPLLLYKFAQS